MEKSIVMKEKIHSCEFKVCSEISGNWIWGMQIKIFNIKKKSSANKLVPIFTTRSSIGVCATFFCCLLVCVLVVVWFGYHGNRGLNFTHSKWDDQILLELFSMKKRNKCDPFPRIQENLRLINLWKFSFQVWKATICLNEYMHGYESGMLLPIHISFTV